MIVIEENEKTASIASTVLNCQLHMNRDVKLNDALTNGQLRGTWIVGNFASTLTDVPGLMDLS